MRLNKMKANADMQAPADFGGLENNIVQYGRGALGAFSNFKFLPSFG
jgi:hypothetical protein